MKHQDEYYNTVICYCVYKESPYNSDWSKRWVTIENFYREYNLCL